MTIIVQKEDVDKRLDNYLSEKLDLSRSKVSKMIKEGRVKVNDKLVKNSYLVRESDEIYSEEYIESWKIETLEQNEKRQDKAFPYIYNPNADSNVYLEEKANAK